MGRFAKSIRFLFSLSLLLALVYAALNFQDIYDQFRLLGYHPSADIKALADKTTMNDKTRRLFYVNHPQIEDKTAFRQHCSFNEQTIVLGCYIKNRGVYLLSVKDKRLAGIEEVTAAHETLHSAYDRLDGKQRARVDKLAAAEFARITDKRLKSTIEKYRQKDPGVVPNELHSIIGTEVRNISPELEEYYSQYFKDRSKIVGFSEQYEAVFTSREAKAAAILVEIKQLETQKDQLDMEIRSTQADLRAEYQALESERGNSDPTSFNRKVRTYNAEVQALNSQVDYRNSLATRHNQLIDKYNGLVFEQKELIKAIDSSSKSL